MKDRNLTLKDAIKKNKLKQFIDERPELQGDKKLFDKTVTSMVSGKSKAVPKASAKKKRGS